MPQEMGHRPRQNLSSRPWQWLRVRPCSKGHGKASGFWYEQGHERRIRASGMVMVIDQAIDNFKADTGQSIPVALHLLLLLSIEECTAGLTGQACQYHVCRPIGLLGCMRAGRQAGMVVRQADLNCQYCHGCCIAIMASCVSGAAPLCA